MTRVQLRLVSVLLTLFVANTWFIGGTANSSVTTCPSGAACLWEHKDYNGCRLVLYSGDSNLNTNSPCGFAFGDDTSSAKNRTGHIVVLCDDRDFMGGVVDKLSAGENINQVIPNDAVTSVYFADTSCPGDYED